MRTRFFIAVLLALLLCAGGSGVLAQKDEDSSRRWLLVQVTDEQGQPVRSACVTVVPKEGEIIFRNADSRGRVRVKKLAAGRYRVTAKGDGYELQGKEVTVGSGNETVAFTLRPRAN
ncbi:MAG TPA: carboxypeptidase-like regulatory domain-containing protein [Pyrinomonadaceae bacterium]|nr:carboxypeptidase-like regulatory domain-containing protein [Pyrinomonadaceae bacterium]